MPRKIWYSENADVYPGIITRNNAVLEYEKFIHRSFYPHIIHPYSTLRVNWEKAFLVIIPFRLTTVSFMWASVTHDSIYYQYPLFLFQLINLLDVVMKFFTGYIECNTEIAVLDPRRIAKKYLSTFFIFDFIPCIPLEFLFFHVHNKCVGNWTLNDYLKCHLFMDLSSMSVVLRLVSFYKYCRNLTKIMLWNYFLLGMLCVSFTIYTTLLFANDFYTVIYISTYINNSSFFLKILKNSSDNNIIYTEDNFMEYFCAFIALLLDCLYYDTVSSLFSNIYVRVFILIVTFFCNILFIAYFIKYGLLKLKTKEKFLDLESRVITFVRKKHLSSVLGYKTLLYFQFLQENKYYREDEIFNYIPDTFKADIFFHLCRPLLKNFYAFENLPTYVLRLLAECMKYQLCLPNEVVLKKDETRLSMYFVQRGTVALYSVKHVELYHFEAGSSFNGRNLILGELASNTYAISIEVTEIYRLDEEDYLQIMRTYPKVMKTVQEKFKGDKSRNSFIVE